MGGRRANGGLDGFNATYVWHTTRDTDPHAEFAAAAERLKQFDPLTARVAISDSRQAHAIVVGEQFAQTSAPVVVRWFTKLLFGGNEARAVAQDTGWFARCILLDEACTAVLDDKVPIDPAALEGEGIQRSVRARAEEHGMARRDAVEFRARGIATLAQTRDENLLQNDPFAFGKNAGATINIVEHVTNGFHRRNRMIELDHARAGGMRVR